MSGTPYTGHARFGLKECCLWRRKDYGLTDTFLAALQVFFVTIVFAGSACAQQTGPGCALNFDGLNDLVLIGSAPLAAPWTVECWVNRQDASDTSAVLLGDANTALKLEQFSNTRQVGFTQYGFADYLFNYVAPTGTWVHLAFVGTSSNTRLYVNGVLQDTVSAAILLPLGQLGADITNRYGDHFKGTIDEFRIWNNARSQAEIRANMFRHVTNSSPGLFACWPFNECSGNTASDVGPQHLTGALQNGPVWVASTMPFVQNDDFEYRDLISGTNISFQASNIGATRETGEPQHGDSLSSRSIWFTWTAPFSGGVVVEVQFTAMNPVIAVYTGNTLSTLTSIAYNNPASYNSGGAPWARAVFTALAGEAYQIAVDGITFRTQGSFTFALKLFPPQANDSFSNAPVITGCLYETEGSFVGGSRETGEPDHGEPTFGQTLWWSWTAPTNGLSAVPVRLMADGVSFPPGIGGYAGNSITTLTPAPLAIRTNGISTEATFTATLGTTYRIALSGKQNDPASVAPLVGHYRFRLNCRPLGLSVTNLVASTNEDFTVSFQADGRVENLGVAVSGPLRVSVSAISGLSTRGSPSAFPPSSVTNLGVWLLPSTLAPGQSVLVPISGTAPATNSAASGVPIGYGVYAELQEQPFGTDWLTVDQTLVLFGQWPSGGSGGGGTGGGVIRLDPDYIGLSAFNPLTSVAALGPATVPEGSSAAYFGKATYADSSIQNFTNTAWSASRFTIATNGVFTAGSVTSDTVVALTAPYSCGGLLYTAMTNVIVIDLPPPSLTNLVLLGNTGLVLTLNGVPGRSNIIEASTNLTAASNWVALATNAPANGLFTFTNYSRTDFSRRFFRAREL